MIENNISVTKTNFLIEKAKKVYLKTDIIFAKLIPEPKTRKIAIFSVFGFIVFFVFLLIIGITISISGSSQTNGFLRKKTEVGYASPVPQKPKTKIQTQVDDLKTQIDGLKFPPGELVFPQIITKLELE